MAVKPIPDGYHTVTPVLTDQFYGDRSAVKDFAGNHWWIHTHIEDVPPEEAG